MSKLVINPSSTCQWQDLILEASKARAINLSEDIESYLVFLLMRFSNVTDIVSKVVALDFLNSQHMTGTQKHQALQEVGDSCLMFAGLFPGRARKKSLKISYYVNVGQTAYLSAAEQTTHLASLFVDLCEQFVPLMDILQTTRELNSEQLALDPIEASELWQDTSSNHARESIQSFANSNPMILQSNPSNTKH